MHNFLSSNELPDSFQYPNEFIRVVGQGILDLDPWIILQGEQLRIRYEGIKERYPTRVLIPFARREDNDDVACWSTVSSGKVFVIHDFASPGYEQKEEYVSFWDWFRSAIETMIDYEP